MLSHHNRELILLAEEWKLLEQYLYIQQNRFGTALIIQREIPEEIMQSRLIVPMALQLLVENAIKHNIVSAEKPLLIKIVATNDTLTVSNTLQTKNEQGKRCRTGYCQPAQPL